MASGVTAMLARHLACAGSNGQLEAVGRNTPSGMLITTKRIGRRRIAVTLP